MTHEAIRQHTIDLEDLLSDRDTLAAQLAVAQQDQNPSGEPMPTGNLPGWRYLMGEDFKTDVPLGSFVTNSVGAVAGPYSGKIDAYPNTYFDTSRNVGRPTATQGQYDTARVVSVSGSVLRKRLHTEGSRPKVAALLPRLPAIDPAVSFDPKWTYQKYGRYAIRSRVCQTMPGFKRAWLLWPYSNTSATDGEIDFPEQNFDSLSSVQAFNHHAPSTPSPNQHQFNGPSDAGWHTDVIEWSPSMVRFIRDGVVIGVDTDRVGASPMRWVIQTETAVSSTPPAIDVQGDVEIDWLAVWAYAP